MKPLPTAAILKKYRKEGHPRYSVLLNSGPTLYQFLKRISTRFELEPQDAIFPCAAMRQEILELLNDIETDYPELC